MIFSNLRNIIFKNVLVFIIVLTFTPQPVLDQLRAMFLLLTLELIFSAGANMFNPAQYLFLA